MAGSEQPEQPPGDPSDPGELEQGRLDPSAAAPGRQEGAGEKKAGPDPAAAAVSQPAVSWNKSVKQQQLEPGLHLWHRPRGHPLRGRAAEGAVQPQLIPIQCNICPDFSIQLRSDFFLILIVNNSLTYKTLQKKLSKVQ